MIVKTIERPMAAITLAESNWENLMVPILKAGLPHSGTDRLFPRDVLHGPSSLQGMGLLHPHGVTRKTFIQWSVFSRQQLGASLDD
jgi:hypothetical protein